jgi:predicted transcriptional regulator
MNEEPRAPEELRMSRKNTHQSKVLLDDEYEGAFVYLAMVHRTKKSVLMREALQAYIDDLRAELKRNTNAA